MLKDFAVTRKEFLRLVKATEGFLYDVHAHGWFSKLHITDNQMWLKREDFQNAVDHCTKRPMLLIAGNSTLVLLEN